MPSPFTTRQVANSSNFEWPLLAESSHSTPPNLIWLNVRYWEKRSLGLASAVKNAEARALGRKQAFIHRPRSPVYRRRYLVDGSLPYSDRGIPADSYGYRLPEGNLWDPPTTSLAFLPGTPMYVRITSWRIFTALKLVAQRVICRQLMRYPLGQTVLHIRQCHLIRRQRNYFLVVDQ